MVYITDDHLDPIFDLLASRYTKVEEIPGYKDENEGFEQFCAVLEQSKSDYYPTLFDKAMYLIININQGHFFSNGNKRLALVTTTTFLSINNYFFKRESKEWYQDTLVVLFPEFTKWENYEEFTPTDFATYNLSILIADSKRYNIDYETLKERCRAFFNKSLEKLE